ncbi:MAG: ATP-binding cassette domain-containing protein, partial [Candidatus Muiribacteriota bacterium]
TLMTSFLEPVKNIMVSSAQYQELEGDMNRLDDVLNYKTDELAGQLEVDYSINKAKLEGNLTLENINFGYNLLEPPLIENFNLKLTPGKRVALVGGSGSGKTTIAKLIGGVTNPWDGKILFDNEERTRENIHIICNSLAVVDQNISLFEATLRDNITLWDSSITDDEILNALKAAEIYDEIMIRPGGLDQLVKENGMNYSGGQRQRIEIARALAINPSILILDEATSALDPVIEEKIDKNIRERGCTCVIVAHRLSTIRDCDEIIVLERGKIVERGTHDELIKNQKYYAELVKSM